MHYTIVVYHCNRNCDCRVTTMFLLAVTGGIGSGKSTVCKILNGLGLRSLSSDEIAREVVQIGSPALSLLVSEMGESICNEDGSLNRSVLAEIIFNSETARSKVNSILHPAIKQKLQEHVQEIEAGVPNASIVVVEVPLLFEAGWQNWFDATILVVATDEVRLARLAEQRGMSSVDARARMSTQNSQACNREQATYIIENNGCMENLSRGVREVLQEIRSCLSND